MKTLFAFVALLTVALAASAQDKGIGTFRLVVKNSNHRAVVVFTTKRFDRSRHKVSIVKQGDSHITKVDGRTALGTDATIPTVEIASMKVYFNGKEIPIPQRLYSDCFEAHAPVGEIKFGDTPSTLFVFMVGSDGAGVYDVIWVLRSDGRHTRFANASGDCALLNMECGLARNGSHTTPRHNKALQLTAR